MLVNGIIGKKFDKALSFYLDRSEEYLDLIEKTDYKPCTKDILLWWPRRLRKNCETAFESFRAKGVCSDR